jgi:phage replication initiation protein
MNFTKIDWLGFRSQAEPRDSVEALRGLFGDLGGSLKATPNKRGWNGFERSDTLSLADMAIGKMAFGGDAMRGWVRVEITGTGCEWVKDWDGCEEHLSGLSKFQTRRVDIALDTYKREVTHETVRDAHASGMFTTCGKPPSMVKIEPSDPYEGRTIYVGKRDQPKFLRAYEKGYQMAQKYPGLKITNFDGVPIGDLYRLELELKSKNQDLPVDLIENRDQYFAGAYPYLQAVLQVEPQIFKQSKDKGPQRCLASMLEIMRTQYGNTLFTACAAYDGDISAVWNKIVGSSHNENLLAEGVLLVDHE